MWCVIFKRRWYKLKERMKRQQKKLTVNNFDYQIFWSVYLFIVFVFLLCFSIFFSVTLTWSNAHKNIEFRCFFLLFFLSFNIQMQINKARKKKKKNWRKRQKWNYCSIHLRCISFVSTIANLDIQLLLFVWMGYCCTTTDRVVAHSLIGV